MQHRKTLSGLIVAPLVIAAIAAPTASAVPADARQLDMYASTVQKAEAAKQDLRSENAADSSRVPVEPADDTRRPRSRTCAARQRPTSRRCPRPRSACRSGRANPEPLAPVSQAPVATGVGDDGIEWPLSGIVIAAALLLGGTLGVAGTRYRVSHTQAA